MIKTSDQQSRSYSKRESHTERAREKERERTKGVRQTWVCTQDNMSSPCLVVGGRVVIGIVSFWNKPKKALES